MVVLINDDGAENDDDDDDDDHDDDADADDELCSVCLVRLV